MSSPRRYGLPLWLAGCVLLVTVSPSAAATEASCSWLTETYGRVGIVPPAVPSTPLSGAGLTVCPSTATTCCTVEMEATFTEHSERWLKKGIANAVSADLRQLIALEKEVEGFFAHLLAQAYTDLHEMFVRAYGVQYVQNADVFSQLFSTFRHYYEGADMDLAVVVHDFFANIFARMFKMINSSDRTLNQQYLESCVSKQLDKLVPFGEIPVLLGQNVKRALVAARTFTQGLNVGYGAYNAAAHWALQPSTQCLQAVSRMLYCTPCGGAAKSSVLTPCHSSCLATARHCFDHQFADAWDKYLGAMDAVAARLEDEGAFNIEAVLGPLKDSISAAIMDYNTNHAEVDRKIKSIPGCQRPSVSDAYPKSNTAGTHAARQPRSVAALRAPSSHVKAQWTLSRLMGSVRSRLKQLRGLWGNAANRLCLASLGMTSPNCHDALKGMKEFNGTLSNVHRSGSTSGTLANATHLLGVITGYLKDTVNEKNNISWITPHRHHESKLNDEGSGSDQQAGDTADSGSGGSGDYLNRKGGHSYARNDAEGSGSGRSGLSKYAQQPKFGANRVPFRPAVDDDDEEEDDDDDNDSGSGGRPVQPSPSIPRQHQGSNRAGTSAPAAAPRAPRTRSSASLVCPSLSQLFFTLTAGICAAIAAAADFRLTTP